MIDIKPKLKYFAFYILMLAFTLVICFLALEIVAAKFYYSNITEISNKEFDPTLGWSLRPGLYWVKPPHTFMKHSLYINELGLRDRDISASHEKNIKRILILGDSFTYAGSIRKEKIFPSLLEKRFNEASGSKYEVINCGVPGYGTAQELLLMQRLSDNDLTGDVYLLMIFLNDILDNLRLGYDSLQETLVQPGFVLNIDSKLELKFLPQEKIPQHSENFVPVRKTSKRIKIAEILKIKIQSFLQTRPDLIRILNKVSINAKFARMPGLLNGWYREDILDAGIPLMKALIREIKYSSEENGAKLLVCIIPSPIQVYSHVYGQILKRTFPNSPEIKSFLQDNTKPQDIIIGICQELKIPFLDLYPIFHANNDKELFIPSDGHFNETGHAFAAQSLSKFIKQNV